MSVNLDRLLFPDTEDTEDIAVDCVTEGDGSDMVDGGLIDAGCAMPLLPVLLPLTVFRLED
jgi:hypothetical protein